MAHPQTCVVISYWNGRSTRNLLRLLGQMARVQAGAPFDVLVVCNGGDRRPLNPGGSVGRVLNRENTGYNIGAWEAGWRHAAGYEFYMFLQDECFLKRSGWVSEFQYRMEGDRGIGLLGESMMWDQMTWEYIRAATDRDLGRQVWARDDATHPLEQYQAFLDARGIPRGEIGAHLQSLVLFTSRRVLEEIGGLPCGRTYREAVACEIGISRLIAAKGYRIAKVRGEAFSLIGHRQWTAGHRRYMKLRGHVGGMLRRLGLKR